MDTTRHEAGLRKFPRRVFFTGSTALEKGVGLCWDRDYGTAANVEKERDNYVELPDLTNGLRFAGVTARAYKAVTGGQWVIIYEPGSVCEIALACDVTVNSGLTTCIAASGAPGRFGHAGLPGRGSAVPLQTVTGMLESDFTGASALDTTGKILTDSSATFETNEVAAGDKVFILGVENDGTDSGTPGEYEVASVDSETQLTLTAAASTTGGTMQCSYFVVSGNPVALALLQGSLYCEESGLIDYVMPPNTGHASNDTFACSPYGVTYLLGGFTSATQVARETLADGTYIGQRKGFYCLGAVGGSYDITVDLATAGLQADGSTAMVGLTFDAADEEAYIEWNGIWRELAHVGGAIDAS